MKLHEIETPALVVDLDAMESNLKGMAAFFRDKPTKLRPHFKNHKAPYLAWKQLEAGAIGITCATLQEAEVLVTHGVRSILIANEIAGESQFKRFADLSRHADVMVAVDDERALDGLASVARQRSAKLSVVVDINIGLNRCGVQPREPALRLAKSAVEKGLRLRGLMGYEGHLQALPPGEERDALVHIADKSLVDSRAMIESAGIPVEIVSTGGTGTGPTAAVYPGITEIQAGSYLLMDTIYVKRGCTAFALSLTLLATVISHQDAKRAVINCGMKELSAERGLSTPKGLDGVELKALHAEHGLLEIQNPNTRIEVGQKIELWVHYSDATVNLHSRMYGVRNGEVEEIIKIER